MTNSLCKDCGVETIRPDGIDYYMVNHKLWKKYGVGEDMLCIKCLEERMGRKLKKSDILVCPITRYYNPYTSKLLLS